MMEETPETRKAIVLQQGKQAGLLEEIPGEGWGFTYDAGYSGSPVSLAMPLRSEAYVFDRFPPVFEGLLPEGGQLEALLRKHKIDRNDYYGQLIVVGGDVVGSLTIKPFSGASQSG